MHAKNASGMCMEAKENGDKPGKPNIVCTLHNVCSTNSSFYMECTHSTTNHMHTANFESLTIGSCTPQNISESTLY
jgi:hypothetical protein